MQISKECVIAVLVTACLGQFFAADASLMSAPDLLKSSWTKHLKDGVGFDLIHREHYSSPFRNPNGAPYELIMEALHRSHARVRVLNWRVSAASKAKEAPIQASVMGQDRTKLLDGEGVVSSLPTGGSQEYYVSLKIGSPPKEVLLTIDTGSELVWIQCLPCIYCYPQIGPIFDPEISTSYIEFDCNSTACATSNLGVSALCSPGDNSCAYQTAYGDGSETVGSLSAETLTLQSADGKDILVPGIIFGCGRLNQGLFAGESGLIGLDRGSLSFQSQLGDLFPRKFSYCLTDRIRFPNATTFLIFGESITHGMRYTPLQDINATLGISTNFYYVSLLGISVGEKRLPINSSVFQLQGDGSGGTIVDSGTYLTYLPDPAYKPLRKSFISDSKLTIAPPSNLTLGLDTCFTIPAVTPLAEIPIVTFHFENSVNLGLTIENLLLGPFDEAGELFCFAFVNTGPITPGSINVIVGNIQQQNFHIEYDLETSQLGFAKQDCNLDH